MQASRQAVFIDKCLNSVNITVEFITTNGVYFSRMSSPVGRSAQLCGTLLTALRDIGDVSRDY